METLIDMTVLPTEFLFYYQVLNREAFLFYMPSFYSSSLSLSPYPYPSLRVLIRIHTCYYYIFYIYSVAQSDGALSAIYVSSFDFGVVLPSRAANGLIALAAPRLAAFSLAPLFFSSHPRSLSSSSHHPSRFPALFLPVLLSCSSIVFSLPLSVTILVVLSLSRLFLHLSLGPPFTPSISVISSLSLALTLR